jgi:hypothetical protein
MQLGWVVRWVLLVPRPPHGWAVRPCRASTLPLLLCTRPARARPSIGGSKTPSCSALAPVESSPGPLTHCPFHRVFILETAAFHLRRSCAQTRVETIVVPAGRSAAVVEPRDALWGRAMHPGSCDLLHSCYFTFRKSCAVGPLQPIISSPSAPCLFSCGEWIKAVSYVCHYSNMSIHMITLAHPTGRVPPGDAT